MSDPTRLFDGAGTEDERRLIGFVRVDTPPSGSLARTLSALGVAGGVLAPAAAHATLLAGAAAGTGAVAGSGAGVTLVAITKWLAIGLVGGTLTAGAVHIAGKTNAPSPRPAPGLAVSATPASRAPTTPSTNQAELTSPPASANPTTRESNPPSDTGDNLREELMLLERARRSLAAGRSDDAREALRRHREAFPTGALGEEADVLRIEVLIARGEHGLAEQAGRDFLDTHPASPHAPRVKDLLVRAVRDPKRNARPSKE